jgi:hypothetical protein
MFRTADHDFAARYKEAISAELRLFQTTKLQECVEPVASSPPLYILLTIPGVTEDAQPAGPNVHNRISRMSSAYVR